MPLVKSYHGLFVGLVTLDLVYLATAAPRSNQKIVASDYIVTAGGPATNAAVTFAHLGNQATLLGAVGSHPLTQLIAADLSSHVTIADLSSSETLPPPISSIVVTEATGERAVVSVNAVKNQASSEHIPADILQGVDVVLIDGHQMKVAQAIAKLAKASNIPVVIDGGSWKPGFAEVLPYVDYAVCSAHFQPPGEETFTYLAAAGISHIAVTRGEKPIQTLIAGETSSVDVPQIVPVDTLGAGDIFHGAFCHYILKENFSNALALAAKVAAHSCQFFGTRSWMQSW